MEGYRIIQPHTDPLWARLVNRERSDVFHSPQWIQVLVDTYALDAKAVILLDEAGEVVAGLPFVRLNDGLGDHIVAMPYCDFCDPIAQTEAQWRQLIQPLIDQQVPIHMRVLHNHLPLSDARFQKVKQARWHLVEIPDNLDDHLGQIESSARRAIKKAQKDGVQTVARQDKEATREFFEMHLGVRKYKFHLLAQPYSFIENIWQQHIATGCGTVLISMHNNEAISGCVALKWQDIMFYKLSASVREELNVRPNDLQLWTLLEYAKANGCRAVDFGLCPWDNEGLTRFKRKYATQEKEITFLKFTPDGHVPLPQEQQLKGLLTSLTTLLTDASVPDDISEKAGALLYRYFV